MDQRNSDKFAELSPVLELVYVMLTNMAKYMDVYAKDIEAEKTEQYKEAREAMALALQKFDALYGLTSADATTEVDTPQMAEEVDAFEDTTGDVSPETMPAGGAAPVSEVAVPADTDPESLQKAKEAVDELKTLFNEMRQQEQQSVQTPVPSTPGGVDAQPPTAPAASLPSFVSPAPSSAPEAVTEAAQMEAVANLPTPNGQVPSPTQDSNEVESILEELKRLQNKGTDQQL